LESSCLKGWASKTRNRLKQSPAFAISPQLPRQRLRSIPLQRPAFRQIQLRQNAASGFEINGLGILHGRLTEAAFLLSRNEPYDCFGKLHYKVLQSEVLAFKFFERMFGRFISVKLIEAGR
jgi:hypothetical protein